MAGLRSLVDNGSRVARRTGAAIAMPFYYIERGLLFALTKPVKPLWRHLDAYSYRFEKTLAAKIIAVALFPALMISAVLLGLVMLGGGLSLGGAGLTLVYVLVLGAILAPIERLIPWSRAWLHREDSGADVLMMISGVASLVLLGPVAIYLTAWLVQIIHAQLPPDTIRSFWPTALHPVLQVALLLVVMDFFRYWYHRWMHENPFMWRWHSVHHSSTRLYWFNGMRSHPLEMFVSKLIWVVPFTLIQAPPEIIVASGLVSLTIGRFQHTGAAVKLGPFEYVFSGPNNHRHHHAKTSEEGNKNYGGDIMLWDHLFGTFYLPKGRRPTEDIGVGGMPDYPQTWTGLMMAPFRIEMWREKARADAAKAAAHS